MSAISTGLDISAYVQYSTATDVVIIITNHGR